MGKAVAVLSIIGAGLIVLGCAVFGVAIALNGYDWEALSMEKYSNNNYEVSEAFTDISVDTKEADIVFLPSEDGTCRVLCYEKERMTHKVAVKGETLEIKLEDNRKWYHHITWFSFSAPKITIYLPKEEYGSLSIKSRTGDVQIAESLAFENMDISVSTGGVSNKASVRGLIKIKTTTGHISVENISAGALDLAVSTGDVKALSIACERSISIKVSTGRAELDRVTCESLTSTGDTGDILLRQVVATGVFRIERSTGDVEFDRSDAGEIYVVTDTGDVKGSLLSDKVFITHTDIGRIEAPKSVNGGRCEISTDTGDIKISIVGK